MRKQRNPRNRAAALVLALSASAVVLLSACTPISLPDARNTGTVPVESKAAQTGSKPAELAQPDGSADHSAPIDGLEINNDYYNVLGPAARNYPTGKLTDSVQYCDLDRLERPVCAYAELTSKTLETEQQEERQSIDIDPPGWNGNEQIIIPSVPEIEESKNYSGWMFNRSHLIADSLGGDAIEENLITGTRTQNVGSTTQFGQYAGGMAYAEVTARNYLATPESQGCSLYYAVTPNYNGDDLLPHSVDVDLQTCDQSIDQHIVVHNTAQGYEIDYARGGYTDITSSK